MSVLITVVHLLACLALVFIVLLQRGKGAEMGAVFGGSSSTVFGSSGAGTFLTKLTTVTAAVFMLTSLALTYLSTRETTATVFNTAPAAAPPAPAPASGTQGAPAGSATKGEHAAAQSASGTAAAKAPPREARGSSAKNPAPSEAGAAGGAAKP